MNYNPGLHTNEGVLLIFLQGDERLKHNILQISPRGKPIVNFFPSITYFLNRITIKAQTATLLQFVASRVASYSPKP